MKQTFHPLRGLAALCLTFLLLCAVLAVPALAEEASYAWDGDLDEIKSYTVTVDPRQDGSADLTYDIVWQVVGGGSSDYLSWVRIGLANSNADEFTALSEDTISNVRYESNNGGDYARVTFKNQYYAPAVAAANGSESQVHFRFSVHQSHLFTLNEDATASFSFTPGWFEDLCVDSLTVRWKNYEGITADNTGTDGDYLTWQFGPLDHGEQALVNLTVPVTTAQAFDPAAARTDADSTADSEPDAADMIAISMFVVLFFVVMIFLLNSSFNRAVWRGGLGSDLDDGFIYYSDGIHTQRLRPGAPPPVGFHVVSAPHSAGFRAGGGSTRGGGASRSGGGSPPSCACACASSCACACACAGGGRAGCSAKNFYRVRVKTADEEDG